MPVRSWWGRLAVALDAALILTFALFLQALFLGGVRLVRMSPADGGTGGLLLVVAEDPGDRLAQRVRHEVKGDGDQLVSVTEFQRPYYTFLGLLVARFALTLTIAPAAWRERYRTRRGRLKPRLAFLVGFSLLLLGIAERWTERRFPAAETTDAVGLLGGRQEGGRQTLQAGAKGEHAGVPVEVNSMGFRGPAIPPRGPEEDTVRVLFLGDSITFGFGVEEEEIFVRRTESWLSERGRAVHCINAGMWSYDTADEVRLLESKIDEVRPDVVVIVFFMNDGMGNIRPGWVARRLYRDLALFRRAYDVYYARSHDLKYTPEAVEAAYRDGQPEWEESKAALDRFRSLAELHGFTPLVVLFPFLETLAEDAYRPAHDAVLAHLAGLGIEALDLYPAFGGRDERALWYQPDDHHPNADGHALAAGRLAPWLESRLPTRGPGSD